MSDHPLVRQGGLTLVELMVAFALLSTVLSLAAPSFQSAIASSRLSTETIDLSSTLSLARMEAVRSGKRITVCTSDDGTTCATTNSWSQGWITFVDNTRAGTKAAVDDGDVLINAAEARRTEIVINGQASVAQYISFAPNGLSLTMNGASLSGKVRVCSNSSALTDDSRARELTLTATGQVILKRTSGVSSACAAP